MWHVPWRAPTGLSRPADITRDYANRSTCVLRFLHRCAGRIIRRYVGGPPVLRTDKVPPAAQAALSMQVARTSMCAHFGQVRMLRVDLHHRFVESIATRSRLVVAQAARLNRCAVQAEAASLSR